MSLYIQGEQTRKELGSKKNSLVSSLLSPFSFKHFIHLFFPSCLSAALTKTKELVLEMEHFGLITGVLRGGGGTVIAKITML